MIIKVNQLTRTDHLTRLAGVPVVGVCVSRDAEPGGPYVDVSTLEDLAAMRAASKLALAFREEDAFALAERIEILERVRPDYLDIIPVDPLKRAAFAEQLSELRRLDVPKIACGFFVQPDDTTFIDDVDPYRELQAAGVDLFQFEVSSAVTPEERLSPGDLRRLERFCADVPVLIGDEDAGTTRYPIAGRRGCFFNLGPTRAEIGNYDLSLRRLPISRILTAVRAGTSP